MARPEDIRTSPAWYATSAVERVVVVPNNQPARINLALLASGRLQEIDGAWAALITNVPMHPNVREDPDYLLTMLKRRMRYLARFYEDLVIASQLEDSRVPLRYLDVPIYPADNYVLWIAGNAEFTKPEVEFYAELVLLLQMIDNVDPVSLSLDLHNSRISSYNEELFSFDKEGLRLIRRGYSEKGPTGWLLGSNDEIYPSDGQEQTRVDEESEILARISATYAELVRQEVELDREVSEARELSISWQRIGDQIGITRQAAMRRFDENAHMKHAAYRRRAFSEE